MLLVESARNWPLWQARPERLRRVRTELYDYFICASENFKRSRARALDYKRVDDEEVVVGILKRRRRRRDAQCTAADVSRTLMMRMMIMMITMLMMMMMWMMWMMMVPGCNGFVGGCFRCI